MPDLVLTEEERMLQAAVREFADRELAPRARECDLTMPDSLVKSLCRPN